MREKHPSPSVVPGLRDLVSVEAIFVLFIYSGRIKTIPELQVIPGDLTLLLLALVVGQVVWGLIAGRLKLPTLTVPVLLVLLFTEYAAASVFWSSVADVNVDKAMRFALLTSSSFFIACILGQDRVHRERLIRLVALVSCVILLYYLYQRFVIGVSSGSVESGAFDRVPASGVNYAEYGDHASLLFIICLAMAVFGSWTQWWGGIAGLCVAIAILAITGGRGPLVFSLLSLPLLALALLAGRNHVAGRLGRLVLLVVALGCFAGIGYTALVQSAGGEAEEFRTLQRMDAQLTGEDTHSMDGRAHGRAMAVDQWLRKPLVGWGIGEFTVQDSYLRYPHNLILEILMETGIVGAVLFLGASACAVFVCVRIVMGDSAAWPDVALVLILLLELCSRLSVQGYLADDRMLFAYMGAIVGYGCARSSAAHQPVGTRRFRALVTPVRQRRRLGGP